MISSFADGTKMNMEMAILANATWLIPDIRGMHCPQATLDTVVKVLNTRGQGGILNSTGVVEVVQSVEPSGGVFVVATTSNPQIRKDLKYLKMGEGPNYLFYRPYHLCAIEMGFSIIRALLHKEATIAPNGDAVAEVIACAKRDLKPGEVLDDIGGYSFYGLIDHKKTVREQRLLPVGLAPKSRVVRPIKVNHPVILDDVEIDQNTVLWKLWQQSNEINSENV